MRFICISTIVSERYSLVAKSKFCGVCCCCAVLSSSWFWKIFAYFLHVSNVVVSLCHSSKANNDHCAFLHATKCLVKMFAIQTTPFNLSGGVFNNWTGWKNMILLFGCRWRREKEILLWKEKSSRLSVRIRGSQKEKEKESKRQNKAYLLISSIARLRSFHLSLQSFVSFCCAPCLLFLPYQPFFLPRSIDCCWAVSNNGNSGGRITVSCCLVSSPRRNRLRLSEQKNEEISIYFVVVVDVLLVVVVIILVMTMKEGWVSRAVLV